MSRQISRRSLLAATGASAFLLPLLNEDRGFAATPAAPKRIMFVVTSNGTIENKFWPTGEGSSFALNQICSPLELYKKQLLFPKGIDLSVWAEDNPFGGNGDAHHNYGSILTGTQLATGDPPHDPGGPGLALASSKSIDVVIGEALGKPDNLPFFTLNVRARGEDGNGASTVSWAGNKAPITSERDPVKLLETLFGGYTPDGPDPAYLKLQKKRQSVLHYSGVALERQAKYLGTDDRRKLELHLDAIATIERQLQSRDLGANCAPPTVPVPPPGDTDMYNHAENFPEYVDVQIDLMVAAMACDLTRVSTFVISDSHAYDTYFPFLDIVQTGVEFPTRHQHDIAHRPGVDDHDKVEVEKWHITKFARLLDKLSEVQEGEGTMLDNTCIFWLNSLNSGYSHTVLNLPLIIAAGSNIPIRTGGRMIDFQGTAHNKLLASLANAMGVPMTSWGDERYQGTLDLT